MEHESSALVLQPKRKNETLIKPQSSGIFERVVVVGGGLAIAYTFAATLPIASIAAIGCIGLHFMKEVQHFQSPKKAKELHEILNARTVQHHSIWESKQALKKQYPTDALNRAIESMIGNCHWYTFKPSDKHYLANFGECYCYVDPHDGEVMLPIHALEKMLKAWQIEPTIEVQSVTASKALVGIQNSDPVVPDEPNLPDLPDEPIDDSPAAISPVNYILGDRLRCLLLVAVSGGGKDLLLAVALREFLQRYQDFNVIVMDCKDDPKEYAYYDGLPRVEVFRMDITAVDPAEAMDWIDGIVQTFVDRKQKTLLICNEGTSVRSISKRYADVVSGLVSNGDSRQMYVWEAGQSGHTDDLKTNGAARSRFRALVISLQGEEMQIEAILQAKWLADSAKNMSDIKAKMLQSPVKRAWSDGQDWFPMAKLTNHSGYDRDTRTTIGTSTIIQVPDTAIQTSEPQQRQPKVDAELELLITMLAATMRKAQSEGKVLSTLTPEKLTQHQIGKKFTLTEEKAKIALDKAKALLGV